MFDKVLNIPLSIIQTNLWNATNKEAVTLMEVICEMVF